MSFPRFPGSASSIKHVPIMCEQRKFEFKNGGFEKMKWASFPASPNISMSGYSSQYSKIII